MNSNSIFTLIHYPFGMPMPGRTGAVSGGEYRYGFNGQEQEKEITESKSHTSAEFWMYDSRLGRRWNLDPVSKPSQSDYETFDNSPISLNDPDGRCTTCPQGSEAKKVYANGATVQDGGEGGKTYMHVDGRWIDISDLPSDYGSNSGYQYTVNDIVLRDYIRSGGKKNPMWRAIQTNEKNGYARQIYNRPNDFNGDHTGDPWFGEVEELTSAGIDVIMTTIAVLMISEELTKPSIVSPGARAKGPTKWGKYAPKRTLPRNSNGTPKIDEEAVGSSHTQLGKKAGRKGEYNQSRQFNEKGEAVKDIDWTNHGRPSKHINPHQHRYIPNETGGTSKRSKIGEPLTIDL